MGSAGSTARVPHPTATSRARFGRAGPRRAFPTPRRQAPSALAASATRTSGARSGGQPAQPVNLGTSDEMLSLVNRSKVTPILNDLMGAFDAPASCQVGVLPPREAGDQYTPVGWRDADGK